MCLARDSLNTTRQEHLIKTRKDYNENGSSSKSYELSPHVPMIRNIIIMRLYMRQTMSIYPV